MNHLSPLSCYVKLLLSHISDPFTIFKLERVKQMSEPFKKVGRGGAGNFYSKKDVQNAVKASGASESCLCNRIGMEKL